MKNLTYHFLYVQLSVSILYFNITKMSIETRDTPENQRNQSGCKVSKTLIQAL